MPQHHSGPHCAATALDAATRHCHSPLPSALCPTHRGNLCGLARAGLPHNDDDLVLLNSLQKVVPAGGGGGSSSGEGGLVGRSLAEVWQVEGSPGEGEGGLAEVWQGGMGGQDSSLAGVLR